MKQILKIRFCLVVLAMLLSFGLRGQVFQTIDSLKQVLKESSNPTQKVDLLNEIAFQYYDSDDSLGYLYSEEALDLAKSIKYSKGLKSAHTMRGIGHFRYGRYAQSKRDFVYSSKIRVNDFENDDIYNLRLLGVVLTDLGELDSANLVFKQAIDIAQEFGIKKQLSLVYRSFADLKTKEFNKEAALELLELSTVYRYQTKDSSMMDIYLTYANAYLEFKDFTKAQEYINKYENSIKDDSLVFYIANLNLLKSELELRKGNYSSALDFGFRAFEITDSYKYPYLRIGVLTVLGEIYSDLSEHHLAINYYLKALSLSESTGLRPFEVDIRLELAWIYKEQKNFDQAFKELDLAQALAIDIKDFKGESSCYNIRGLVFMLIGNFTRSELEFKQAMSIRKRIGYEFGTMSVMFNMGLLYREIGKYEEALKVQYEALEIDKRYNQPQSLAISYNAISSILIKLNRLDEALKYLDVSFENAKKSGSKMLLRNCYQSYSQLFEAKNDINKSYYYLKIYQQYNDSIYTQASITKIAEMQALYQVERKQGQIDLLNKQKELQTNQIALGKTQIRSQYYIIIGASIIFIILIISIIIVYKFNRNLLQSKIELAESNEELQSKQEEIQAQSEELSESNSALAQLNEELQESQKKIKRQAEKLEAAHYELSTINKDLEYRIEESLGQLKQAYNELDTFFYRASHDFRRPITTFLGLAEVANITVTDVNALDLFSKVKETATNLDRMILKLQSISDIGSNELNLEDVDIKEIFEEVIGNNKELGVQFELNVPPNSIINTYPIMLQTILRLAIENSVDFKSIKDPFIKCYVQKLKEGIEIVIDDNGVGISSEYIDRVFDMYFRANESSKGNGLGLYIIKRAVGRLRGTVNIASKINIGTTITIFIPTLPTN